MQSLCPSHPQNPSIPFVAVSIVTVAHRVPSLVGLPSSGPFWKWEPLQRPLMAESGVSLLVCVGRTGHPTAIHVASRASAPLPVKWG